MPQVKRSRQAQRDLKSIVGHIAADNPPAADRWLDQIERIFDLTAAHPEAGERIETRRYGIIRRHCHGNYVIYYRPRTYGVFLVRVLHGARERGRSL